MKRKIVSIIMVIMLLGLATAGCGKSKTDAGKDNKPKNETAKSQDKPKEPAPNISEEQKKHPLPEGAKPYAGIIKSVEDKNVTIDVQGVELKFKITDKTNLQKGSIPGSGKLEDLKTSVRVNVLVKSGEALSVQYQ